MSRLVTTFCCALLGGAVLAAASGSAPRPVSAASARPLAMTVSGSPFSPDGDGRREKVSFEIRLAEPATLRLDVIDFDGQPVRVLLGAQPREAGSYVLKWNGRDEQNAVVDDGPYTARATALSGDAAWVVTADFTKARRVIYKPRPGAIVVAIDPGHGDVYSEPGRYAPDGTHESVINLDIGLRLRKMLEGAGVRTVISRTTAGPANSPEWDRNGDGLVGYSDELAARCDIANEGRADVYISIHNNLATNPRVGGPSTYYRSDRSFGASSLVLARAVQANMLARLDLYRTDTWRPSRSHGVLSHHPYYVLSSYTLPDRPRPTLMPGVLSEGMFLTHPYELSLLKQPRVRQSMAAAYYDAIQAFIAKRPYAAGYDPLAAPPTALAGDMVGYRIQVTNKGQLASSGWVLEARAVPAATLYDGSGARGELIGTSPVPALARGGKARVDVSALAPGAGEWLVKFDVRMADGSYLSDRGLPALQLPLSVSTAP